MYVDLDESIEQAKTDTSNDFAKAHIRAQNTFYTLARNLIAWATVMLSLSAAFADKLHKPSPACLWLLQVCLGFLAATILSGVFVCYGEVRLHELTVGALLQKYLDLQSNDENLQASALQKVYSATNSKCFSNAVWIEIGSFALATLALAIFAIVNI